MQQAQARALVSGETAAIASASRVLAAHLLRQLGESDLVAGQPSDAADLYQSSLLLENNPEAHLELASVLLRIGKVNQAADEAALAISADTQNASAWAIRGTSLRAIGDKTGAIAAFEQALALRPSSQVAYTLASTLLTTRQETKAAAVFKNLLQIEGNTARSHVAIGDAYRQSDYPDQAIAEFTQALSLDHRTPLGEFFLGLMYLQQNGWGPNEQSFRHLREAVRQAPHEYISNFYLGAMESTAGADLAASNRHLHVAAEADPSAPEVWLYLGLNAQRERNVAMAETFLRKSIALTGFDEPRNNYQVRKAYSVLGHMLLQSGHQAEGEALLARYKIAQGRSIANSRDAIAQAGQRQAASDPSSSIAPDTAPASLSALSASVPLTGSAISPSQTSVTSPSATRLSPAETKALTAQQTQLRQLLAASLNDLGTAEARQQQYAAAKNHFAEAARWDKPSPALLRNLGVAAFRTEDFPTAARSLGEFLQSAPAAADPRTQLMYALSLFSLGDFPKAAQAFAPASVAASQDPRAAYAWAFSLARSGDPKQADHLASQLASQPMPADRLALICHIFIDTENYQDSAACYRKVIAANPSLPLAHYQLAESLVRLDRPSEAIPELRHELALSPDDPNVQYSMAFALLQTSSKDEAFKLLRQITTAHPEQAQAQYQFGKLLLDSGNLPDAITHLELAEQTDASSDYIHYQLQAAYRKAGRTADADREARLYREIKAHRREIKPAAQP